MSTNAWMYIITAILSAIAGAFATVFPFGG